MARQQSSHLSFALVFALAAAACSDTGDDGGFGVHDSGVFPGQIGGGTTGGGTTGGATTGGGTTGGGLPGSIGIPGSTTGGGTTGGFPGSTTGGGTTGGFPGSTTGGGTTGGATTGGGTTGGGTTGGATTGGGTTGGGTTGGGMGPPPPAKLSGSTKGPLKTAELTLSSGTAYYPSEGGPFPAIAIIPGFVNSGPEMTDWGPFLASWGIICVVTTSGPLDFPDARAQWLQDAIKELKSENTKSGGKLNGKLSGQYGTSGYSMGGGGTTIASAADKSLKSSVGLAPWTPVGAGITTPTLHFCGDVDVVADCSHAQASYDAIPAATPKMMITVSGCDHLTCWFGPADTPEGVSGGWALAFHKVYLQGDERWKPLLMGKPPSSTVQTNIK